MLNPYQMHIAWKTPKCKDVLLCHWIFFLLIFGIIDWDNTKDKYHKTPHVAQQSVTDTIWYMVRYGNNLSITRRPRL